MSEPECTEPVCPKRFAKSPCSARLPVCMGQAARGQCTCPTKLDQYHRGIREHAGKLTDENWALKQRVAELERELQSQMRTMELLSKLRQMRRP